MSEEVSSAEVPAPELEATVAPVSEVQTPEEAPKTFSQEELDAAIGKRLAREQRKWEREQSQRSQPPAAPVAPPSADQFGSVEEYADALATQKAHELVSRQREQQEQSTIIEAYHDKEEEVRGKYDDFEQVAYNPKLPISNAMAETIQASDIGPDIAYYLGSNPKEAARIAALNSPILQAKEIGRIEAKIASEPVLKKTTSAPPPIAPISGRGSGSPSYDTTDPRAIKNMSTSEWIEADRQRQMKKWEAQRNR